MSDEIKEIISYLKNKTFIPDETKRKYKILHRDEVNKLLDYITNLQQENERLKDSLETMTFTTKVKQEAVDSLISRIDKAVEYINHAQNYGTMAQVMPHLKFYVNGNDLLNILQGEKDN
jgi:cell division septum initiation protein DivIVA